MRYELLVGLRYTRAKRRNRFIGFNSAVSMIGIALGVAALIVVLSVMNGFQKEVRTRILGVASHVQIIADDNRLEDWQSVAKVAAQHPRVRGAAPFVQAQAMLSNGQAVRGALVRGILPGEEEKVADLGRHMRAGTLDALRPGEFGIVLGAELARALGVLPGDKVALIAPQGIVTPAGVIPRLKQFTVVGIFEVGIYESDSGLALMHLQDAQKLYQLGDAVTGVRLKLDDLFAARAVARELLAEAAARRVRLRLDAQPRQLLPRGRDREAHDVHHPDADRAVAAFNIVSTLVMVVTDKQADIAILRTLGAAPGSIMQIFMVQGMVIGVIGTLAGVLVGIVTALNIDVIVPAIESALRHQVPVEGRLPHHRPAFRPAVERRDLDRADGARAVVRRHALPELARRARQSGRSAAL